MQQLKFDFSTCSNSTVKTTKINSALEASIQKSICIFKCAAGYVLSAMCCEPHLVPPPLPAIAHAGAGESIYDQKF
jgi:hypothetical protein